MVDRDASVPTSSTAEPRRPTAPTPTPSVTLSFTLTAEAHAAFERARAKLGRTRHIPKSTLQAVFERDGHRCTFVAPDGTRCTATHDLQIDHVEPFARGGGNELENLRTMCGAHDRRLGEVAFDLVLRAEARRCGT